MPSPVLAAEHLSKTFVSGREPRAVLTDVSLAVAPGEWVAITGPSGVGKTTLLHVLAGILPPDAGRVEWLGTDLYALGESARDGLRVRDAGIVFQFHHLMPDLTVEENIRLALRMARTNGGPGGHDGEVRSVLDRLGLADRAASRIEELSGGERQRIAVARALIHQPKILFADEPTGHLDGQSASGVLDLIDEACKRRQVAVVLSTHNPAVAARVDRRVDLRSGRLQTAGE